MITSNGYLAITPEHDAILKVYGQLYLAVSLKIYNQCIIHNKEWYSPGSNQGLRFKLMQDGWTKRELESIYKQVIARQVSLVECIQNNLIELEQKRDKLKLEIKKLQKSEKKREKKKAKNGFVITKLSLLNAKSRRLNLINTKINRLEHELINKPRLTFGSKKMLRQTQYWEMAGYKSQQDAHAVWQRKRAGLIAIEGDRESSYGNPSLQLILDESASRDNGYLRVILPKPVAKALKLPLAKRIIEIPVIGFTAKNNRADIINAQKRLVCNDRRRGTKEEWDDATPIKSRQRSADPVTLAINWDESKSRWYLHASVKDVNQLNHGPKKAERQNQRHYVLTLDLNVNHVAYSLVKPDGNILAKQSGKLPLLSLGTTGQKLDSIGCCVREIVKLHAAYESMVGEKVILAAEILNFQRAKQELRYHSPQVANKLSSFAYSRYQR